MPIPWDYFKYLETEPTARQYLIEAYTSLNYEHPERLAFQNSSRFFYTWKQANVYYHTAAKSNLLIKPLLLFYGCVLMLKGVLLTRRPQYPQNSRMLQHGVTTRKLKRNAYQLLQDEIRPQKEGLFSQLIEILPFPPVQERYSVDQLFASLAELADDYKLIVGHSNWKKVSISDSEKRLLQFPAASEGTLVYSAATFIQYLNRLAPKGVSFHPVLENHQWGENHPKQVSVHVSDNADLSFHPLFNHLTKDVYLFWSGESESLIPKWASHYLILYLLGMLCRYETEWWGELILSHSQAEVYLVDRFLSLHENDFPAIICKLLLGK